MKLILTGILYYFLNLFIKTPELESQDKKEWEEEGKSPLKIV